MLFEPNTKDGKEVATYETIVSNSTRQKDPSLVWTDFKFNVITLINAKCLYIHRDLAGAWYYYGWASFIYAMTLRPYDWLSNKPTGSPTLAASIFWSMKKFVITSRHLDLVVDERVRSTFLCLSLIPKVVWLKGITNVEQVQGFHGLGNGKTEKSITSVPLFCEWWYNFLFLPIAIQTYQLRQVVLDI